jgi:hypothetical protein
MREVWKPGYFPAQGYDHELVARLRLAELGARPWQPKVAAGPEPKRAPDASHLTPKETWATPLTRTVGRFSRLAGHFNVELL